MISLIKKNTLTVFLSISIFLIVILYNTGTAATQVLHIIGQKPSDFTLKAVQGEKISLADYSDKKAVILLFWSSWSRKSKEALKRFEGYYDRYAERGIQVIGINADNQRISDKDIKKIKQILSELGVTYPVAIDDGLDTFHNYGIIALPSTVIISEDKITYALPGLPLVKTEEMFEYLLVLVGEPPRKKFKPSYKPKYDAVAAANLARKFTKKQKMSVMAIQQFKKAIKKDATYLLPYVELALLYEAKGNIEKAEEVLNEARKVDPENITVMSELGYLLAKSGRTKEAFALFEKAVQLDSYTPAQYYFAYTLGMDGQREKSLEYFNKAIELNPFDANIYLLRAEVYENYTMYRLASLDYKKALELLAAVQN